MNKTAQQQHDEQLASNPTLAPGSKEKLETLLQAKTISSPDRSQADEFESVALLLKKNPTLTIERIEQMAEAHGL
jgi:hypothetical protein